MAAPKITKLPAEGRERKARRVQDVRRRDGFYHRDGKKYVAVSSILKTLNAPALITWAARTAASLVLADPDTYSTAEQAASGIYGERDKAASRGTTVHSIAEAVARGGDLNVEDLPASLYGYGVAFRTFWEMHRPEPIELEANVYSDRYGYAGTTDLIAKMQDGRTFCVDYKSRKRGQAAAIYDENRLQLHFYANADYILPRLPNIECRDCGGSGTAADERGRPGTCRTCAGGGMVPEPYPLPKIDSAAVVLLGEDGTFAFHEVALDEKTFQAGIALMRVFLWQRGL